MSQPNSGPQTWRQRNSLAKLSHLVREKMLLGTQAISKANLDAVQKEQYGNNYQPPGEEMIVNDSPITHTETHHHYPQPEGNGFLKKLIPIAAAAALAGTGVGAAVGIPLLINHFFPKTSDTKVLTGGAHVIVEPGIVEPPTE